MTVWKKSKVSVHTETMSLKTSGMQEVGYKQEVLCNKGSTI